MGKGMLRRTLPLAMAIAGLAVVAPGTAFAANGDRTCGGGPNTFGEITGSVPHDVIVPAGSACDIHVAMIGHDVIIGQNTYVGISSTTVGHDITGNGVSTFETANFAPDPGPVYVGHDITLTGKQNNPDYANGYTICDTTVQHDITISGTSTPYTTEIGDNAAVAGEGTEEFCAGGPDTGNPADFIGHDLVITNNVFGRLDVGDNSINHDMLIANNTATTAFGDVGTMDVSDNKVGHQATCSGNTPPPNPGGDGDGDGPNHAPVNHGCP